MSGYRTESSRPVRTASLSSLIGSLDKMFQPGYPFPDGAWKEATMPDGKQIADYVRRTIRDATEWMAETQKRAGRPFRAAPGRSSSAAAKPKISQAQTARSVIVRVRIPPRRSKAGIRVSHDPSTVFIRGVGPAPLRIALPACVSAGGGSARIRKGVLEIRLRKSGKRRKLRELWVQY